MIHIYENNNAKRIQTLALSDGERTIMHINEPSFMLFVSEGSTPDTTKLEVRGQKFNKTMAKSLLRIWMHRMALNEGIPDAIAQAIAQGSVEAFMQIIEAGGEVANGK